MLNGRRRKYLKNSSRLLLNTRLIHSYHTKRQEEYTPVFRISRGDITEVVILYCVLCSDGFERACGTTNVMVPVRSLAGCRGE